MDPCITWAASHTCWPPSPSPRCHLPAVRSTSLAEALPPAGCIHMTAKDAPAMRLLKPGTLCSPPPTPRSQLLLGLAGFNPHLSRPVLPPSWRRLQPQPAYLLPSVQHSNPFLFPSLCSKHSGPCPRPHPFHGLSRLLDLSHGIHLLLLLVKLLFIPQSPSQPRHLVSHALHAPAPRG